MRGHSRISSSIPEKTHPIEGPIGVFDSGVGGLTVVAQLRKLIPHKQIVYFGDTARVPYGTKSKETITRFAFQDVKFLLSRGVGLIIAACHSVSSNSLEELNGHYPVPLVGVIEPGAQAACRATRSGQVGVIGTAATIESGSYRRAIAEIDPTISVTEQSCPLFVPLAEEGWNDRDASRLVAEEYLEPLKRAGIDTLILGCTHYPLLRSVIETVMDPGTNLIDCAEAVSRMVQQMIGPCSSAHTKPRPPDEFYLSDVPRNFVSVAERFLGTTIGPVKRIDLDD